MAHHPENKTNSKWPTDIQSNSRLYELLQVEPSVPAEEINKTFKSLTLRKQYKIAFNIIGNADKKRLYDIAGESIVSFFTKSWGDVVTFLGSTKASAIYGISWILVTILLTIFFILLPLRIDKYESWNWHGVLTPLYIILIGSLFGAVFLVFLACFSPTTKGVAYRHPLTVFLFVFGYTVFAFLTGTGLQNGKSSSWIGYFVILMVVDFCWVVEWMTWVYPRRIRRILEPIANTVSEQQMASRVESNKPGMLANAFLIIGVIDIILSILRWVFIGLRVDSSITCSWYWVLVPMALWFLSGVFHRLINSLILQRLGQMSTCQVVLSILGSISFNACWIIVTFLVAYVIENRDSRVVFALIPLYLVLFYLLVASIFTLIYLLNMDSRMRALEEDEALHMQGFQDIGMQSNLNVPNNENNFEEMEDVGEEEMERPSEPVSSIGTESIVSENTIIEDDTAPPQSNSPFAIGRSISANRGSNSKENEPYF